MASRPSTAPNRVSAGYTKLQRHLTRTTQRTDLNVVVPRFSKRLRRQLGGLTHKTPLAAVLGISAALAVVAVVVLGLSGTDAGKARMSEATPLDDARSVSLQVSGGFGVDGSVVRSPDSFADPNAGAANGADDPLSRLLDGLAGGGSAPGTSGAASAGTPGTSAVSNHGEGGAPIGSLSNPELVKLFDATNVERTRRGLDALVLDTSLNRSAQRHADWMADHGLLCHSNECDGAGEPDPSVWNGWGENIAYSTNPTAHVVQNAFMESPPHRENLLDPRHNFVGLGWAVGRLADTDKVVVFVVVQFGMQRR